MAKGEIEKGYDKSDILKFSRTGDAGQKIISNFLGGAWTKPYQIRLIAETLFQIRAIDEEAE